MSMQNSGNIISIFESRVEAPLLDDPLRDLLNEFSDLSDDIEEEVESVMDCMNEKPTIDLSMLTDAQLFEYIESRLHRLKEMQKRLHYYNAEFQAVIE